MKIGRIKDYDENKVYRIDQNYPDPIIISEELDLSIYDDVTSIENWDKYQKYTDIETIRNGIYLLVDSISWVNLSTEEKNISSKWFVVDKSLRDEVQTDDQQINNINRLINKQKKAKVEDFSEIYNSTKIDIDKYLEQIKISNYIKSTDFTKNNSNGISTTSTNYTLMIGNEFSEVSPGSYFLNFNCNISGPNTGTITTSIFINDTLVEGSENIWQSNDAPGRSDSVNRNTHSYINFPITISSLSNISIRWKTGLGVAQASNITFSLIKL